MPQTDPNCGRIFFNLFARTLERTLYKTLLRLMGWHYETNSGFFTFRIKVIKEWHNACGRVLLFKFIKIASITSLPTKNQ